jgi:tetratricopeptide (TPR) repeat protein
MHQATIEAIDAPPGYFRLVFSVHGAQPEEQATQAVPVMVAPYEGPEIWAAVDPGSFRRSGPVIPSGSSRKDRLTFKDLELEERYRRALSHLAAGDEVIARRAVAELERAAFKADPGKAHDELSEIAFKTARTLTNKESASLMPVIMMHHNLVHSYLVREQTVLAQHAWRLTADLSDLLCTVDESEGCRDRAAQTLVSLACYMIQERSGAAAALFDRALKISPDNLTALMGLAVIHERMGSYEEAIPLYERLVEMEPGYFEARLHLGITYARTGRDRRAMRLLRELTRSGAPAWIQTLAYQELAQTLRKVLDAPAEGP